MFMLLMKMFVFYFWLNFQVFVCALACVAMASAGFLGKFFSAANFSQNKIQIQIEKFNDNCVNTRLGGGGSGGGGGWQSGEQMFS